MSEHQGFKARSAIVLAGGLGTRLRPVVGALPKPMAPIAGRPFLHCLCERLVQQGIEELILSVGYRAELIREGLGEYFHGARVCYVEEDQPLGTGGAIRKALQTLTNPAPVWVVNGDTLAWVHLAGMARAYEQANAEFMMAAYRVPDTARYGRLTHDKEGRLLAMVEKGVEGEGLINAGVYLLTPTLLDRLPTAEVFSFEQDFLLREAATLRAYVYPDVADFIDIGIPEDFERAQTKIPSMMARPV